MIPLFDIEQGTDEWFKARVGVPSASNFDKLITTQGKPSTQRDTYLYQLVGEALTGTKEDTFTSKAMEIGIEREAEARALYEMLHDTTVQEVGFCYLDDKKRIGCSPDGLVGDDGLVEIKCPKMVTHVGYLLKDKMPTTYIQQVQGQLYVTGRDYCDFISYYPSMRPFICRVEPDFKVIDPLRDILDDLIVELDEIVNQLKED